MYTPPLTTATESTVASISLGPVLGNSSDDGPVEATAVAPVEVVEEVLFVEFEVVLVDDVWPPEDVPVDD